MVQPPTSTRRGAIERALGALRSIPRPREWGQPVTCYRAGRFRRRLTREGYTMLAPRYGRELFELARELESRRVPGAIVDCGVYNGGSTLLMSTGAPSRMVWAFDSFEGLPESTAVDGPESKEWVGEVVGSERKLVQGFEKYADRARLRIAKGWFEETLPRYRGEIGPIALLHIDADWYESVRVALEELYPLVVPEGYVAIDDYKVWPGAKAATDEFRERNQVSARFVGGHYWKKPRNRVAAPARA